MKRCINIDWLEVHVLEDNMNYPHDAAFFRREGWRVEERAYGTRVYLEMFTLYDKHDEPFLEVRRAPKSSDELHGVLDINSCHIRLTNRACYFPNAVQMLRDFLARYGYEFRRIFRIDLCMDFERFDLGDDPQKFVLRYLNHKYAKINQCNRTTRGQDRWDGCEDNYISWGQPKSMVSTKLYNKTKELAEVHMKPYIVRAWLEAGLITNPITMVKVRKDGTQYTPVIWRVEFSIKSGNAGWAILEDCTGAKNKKKPIAHSLSNYDTPEKLLHMYASLAHHYFHFKVFEPNVRKDRCRDKVLFHFDMKRDEVLKLTHVASSTPPPADDERLRRALERYREKHFEDNVRKAIGVLLDNLNHTKLTTLATVKWNVEEVRELRQILRRRMELPEEDYQVCVDTIRRLMQQEGGFF